MDTAKATLLRLTLALLLATGATASAQARSFCVAPPHDKICPEFPQDQKDFSRFFEYRVVDAAAQAPFDEHAWQAFVALNWSDISAHSQSLGWRRFQRPPTKPDKGGHACGPVAPGDIRADLTQSDGNMLIDQNGNFTVYEKRLNDVAVDYILSNNLFSHEGRLGLSGDIAFPMGVDRDHPASVLVKTAWRVLPEADPSFISATGVVPVPASLSTTGTPLCLHLSLGLIGMHIVSKVQSGNGDKWLWSTFERVDNVPTAANARAINSLYASELFPEGCRAPKSARLPNYLLFDPDCPECETNVPAPATARWAPNPPFARTPAGTPLPASQIVRCWRVFGPTAATNLAWQTKLKGTPLQNYMLVSSQWRGANPDPIFTHGELPRYLSNITMESFVQTDPAGTCLGCHAGATTAEGASSDFTFLLRN